jgi:hypothetical protein
MKTCSATLVVTLALALQTGSAFAQQPPDCSAGPIPDRPLELSFGADKIAALPAIKVTKIGSELSGGKPVSDQYQVSVEDKDMFSDVEATFTVKVPAGQRVDGKTFRTQSAGDLKQILWGVKRKQPSLSASFVGFVASARVEFGKRKGDVLPGRVYLCVPGGQTEKMFGTKLPDPITLVGHFEAKVR